MRQQPEKAEQAAIVKLLKLLGASVYIIGTKRRKGDYQGTMQTPGLPDLYCVLPSPMVEAHKNMVRRTPLWIEVKAKTGRISGPQRRFQCDCLDANIPHLVGGIDVVTDWLRQGGWIK